MREETVEASWEISFPEQCTAEDVSTILNAGRLFEWDWDLFIWDLAYLKHLLTEQPAVFDTLFVTRFLMARASHLLMTGPFKSSIQDVWAGIAHHKLQFGALFHFLILDALRETIKAGALDNPRHMDSSRWFMPRVMRAEREFLRVVEVICLMPDTAEDFDGYPLSCWTGAPMCSDSGCASLIPRAVDVAVRVDENAAFRKLTPCRKEMARLLREKRPIRALLEFGHSMTETDRDLQRMARAMAHDCLGRITYGEDRIGYYRTFAVDSGKALLVVCGDRTMVLTPDDSGAFPATYPKRIYPGQRLGATLSPVYHVEFDNGVSGYFAIAVRAHSESEARLAPHVHPASPLPRMSARATNLLRAKVERARRERMAAQPQEQQQPGGSVTDSAVATRPHRTTARSRVVASGRMKPAALTAKAVEATPCRTFGGLKVYGDFESVMVAGVSYELGNAVQGRAFLRFLCEVAGAVGEDKAVTKQQIREYLRKETDLQASDWRPAQVFRCKLAKLYEAIGRTRTKGTYWIKT